MAMHSWMFCAPVSMEIVLHLENECCLLWPPIIHIDAGGHRNDQGHKGNSYALVRDGEAVWKSPGPGVDVEAEGHHSQSSHCGAGRHADAEVHISINPEGEDIRDGAPRAAPHDEDSNSLEWFQTEANG